MKERKRKPACTKKACLAHCQERRRHKLGSLKATQTKLKPKTGRGEKLNLKAPKEHQLLQSITSCFQMFLILFFSDGSVAAVVVACYNCKEKDKAATFRHISEMAVGMET